MQTGKIYCEQAYAQAKMLDHSTWKFNNGYSFSDIDMVLDDNGKILMVEISSKTPLWHHIPVGQRRLAENFVIAGRGDIVCCLAQHNAPRDRQIDSMSDIIAFSWMNLENGEVKMSPVYGKPYWRSFVSNWGRK